mmetsp:Transcript_8063/g.27599  ORF Transcript_8063/g.27599 Transcript_8063/m.27599 type:complete len:210 (-) Transcript_8063:1947-2576(-)
MTPRCWRPQPARTSASTSTGASASRFKANSSADNSAFLMKPPLSSYLSAMASQSMAGSLRTLPLSRSVRQISRRCAVPGGAYSRTVEMRRCMASSSSAGRFVARNTRPLCFSISWSMARSRRSPPLSSRLRKSASHSSKKSTASDISASRKRPRRSASTSSPPPWECLPRSDAKSTWSTRLPRRFATPWTVIVLPVPDGPHSSTMNPEP